jgi:hypothetical protein
MKQLGQLSGISSIGLGMEKGKQESLVEEDVELLSNLFRELAGPPRDEAPDPRCNF